MKVAAMVAAAVMVVGGAGTLTVTKLSAHEEERVPAEVQQKHDELVAMQKQLDAIDDLVRNQRQDLDEFRKANDLTGVADLVSLEVNRLARLSAQVDEADVQLWEAKYVVAAKRSAKDLPAGELEKAEDAYARATTTQTTLHQMRDDCEKRLKDMDHFLVQDQRKSADLKAMEDVRTKLHVEWALAVTKQ
jgi:hypothetical protein